MMIGYYTDNSISQGVMRAFSRRGVKVEHVDYWSRFGHTHHIFYGILRGTGRCMMLCQNEGRDFFYLDNGYFDAVYMDENKQKDMSGKYRVVKNQMIEPINIEPIKTTTGKMRVMMIPPSPYTAFMHDTTPEDWLQTWHSEIKSAGHEPLIREKDNKGTFEKDVKDFDAVFSFNSMAVMKAIELGIPVYTTHGVIRNANKIYDCAPYYDIVEMKKFYEPKQFTLEEIADLGVKCLPL